MTKGERRRAKRIAIVKEALRILRLTIKEFYALAAHGAQVLVATLKKIPKDAMKLARKVVGSQVSARRHARERQHYRRTGPAMMVH